MNGVHMGGCLCGAVRFRVDGPMSEVVFCHCGQCRRQTGLYYASTNAAEADLTIEGGGEITWYESSEKGRRGFCKHCGSALFWKYRGRSDISVQAGSLDMPTRLKRGYHIFCDDKGDFYEIDGGLPRYARGRPSVS